ncbi:MAG TPA: WecB/TagA/CpsF family glycosyltransferase [Burkholderiaceae bacterium]|nr:WecB/TagA/CpsF family glycosyltransferase [Burkholderiaceae bacterium]
MPPASAALAPARLEPRADFQRRVVSVLGLPFDVIGLHDAVERIRRDAFADLRCFVSTPNLNFAMTALDDAAFRGSVLRSDLCLADGMPVVWVARLLGLPIRERVSGADVFEALVAHTGAPLPVYLFGGQPGAAARACERINAHGGGLRCVGFDAAGFGPVASMSGDEQIARINDSGAKFVVVSLGARKGQAWIEHNATRLRAPVLAHLGAVMNFAAGTVRRAPASMQALGLEWLWRVSEEPALWRRYGRDALQAAGLVATRVVPDALLAWRRGRGGDQPKRLDVLRAEHGTTLRLGGTWIDAELDALRTALAQCSASDAPLTIDLAEVNELGAEATGLLLVASGWFGARAGFRVAGIGPDVASALRRRLAFRVLSGSA